MEIIETALSEGRTTLSEFESTQLLASYGIPVTRHVLVQERAQLGPALAEVGYPAVLKACSAQISHKTEQGLVRLDIRTEVEASAAYDELRTGMGPSGGTVLVQEMVKGERQLMAGLTRDPQFGPAVMFGLGGILTEILKDVCFRLAPLEKQDALDMMRDFRGYKILGAVRGMEPVDRESLAATLINLGRIGLENPRIKEIDINPLIVKGAVPVAVDALVVLE
jgi:acetate---CoA ligase (ADP-forming) subunit beta